MPEGYTHAYIAQTAAKKSGLKIEKAAAFIAGAQGGDLLFSFEAWKPAKKRRFALKELGNRMHEESTGEFLRNLAKHAQTPAQLDYFMGFVSHYCADTVVHPYVTAVEQAGQPYHQKNGHGYFEIALDSYISKKQTGRKDFVIDDFAPKLNGAPLAEVVAQLHGAILDTYEIDVPWKYLVDAVAHNRNIRSIFSSKYKLKYALYWLVEPLFGGRGTITVHVHPRKLRGFSKQDIKKGKVLPKQWQDKETGEVHEENIDELIERAIKRTQEMYQKIMAEGATKEFWQNLGSFDYVTGTATKLSDKNITEKGENMKNLSKEIDAFINSNETEILENIARLIAIDSVETEPAPDAPYGEGAKAALEKTIEIANELGLATKNCENHIGFAEVAGEETEKYLASICHVDVVPVGNGWDADPFTMQIKDGWMIGRGVADDKAPMIATLYALKFIQDQNMSLRYPIRAIIGTNEETGMRDVRYYLQNYEPPVFCFTPDAEFPVCNGEKGHFFGKLVSPVCDGKVKDFVGGVANNAVPDRASALVDVDINTLTPAENILFEQEGDFVRVEGQGIAGHAAMPQGTVNAIGVVVNYLLANDVCNEAERAYFEDLQKLHCHHNGKALCVEAVDEPFGALTIVGGRIYMENGKMYQTMDSRFPTTTSCEKMKDGINSVIKGSTLENAFAAEPFYISTDSPAIKACIDTFNEVTGQNAEPFTMGGGTYARHFPYAVSFGPEHKDTVLPPFGGPMHGANEAAPIDKLLESIKIYILALLKLEEIDF